MEPSTPQLVGQTEIEYPIVCTFFEQALFIGTGLAGAIIPLHHAGAKRRRRRRAWTEIE